MTRALVIGAMKAGTTTLYSDLARLPDVACGPKESGLYSRSTGSLPPSSDARVTVDVCADYSMGHRFPDVPRRVAQDLGVTVPLIYLLRDPLERVESHLRHLSSLGEHIDPDALDENHHVVLTSRYGYQCRRWVEAGHEGMACIDFHTYSADRFAGLTEIARWIGAEEPGAAPTSERVENSSQDLRSARPLVRGLVRSRAYRATKPLIPQGVRRLLKNSPLTEAANTDVRLAPGVRARLQDVFRADLADLCDLVSEVPQWAVDYGRGGC